MRYWAKPVGGLVLGCAIAALMAAASVSAQTVVEAARVAAEVNRVAGNLPEQSKNVITRLTLLRELPDGEWKTHSGDLAHGEAVDLNESDWKPIAHNSKAPNEAVWFRQTYTVPATLNGYDLTGSRIWFQFNAYANGPMPEIVYFNGRRVALGDDLEPIVLFDKAKPGDKVTVAVKLLHTVDEKNFQNATLEINYADGRPNPEDLREEFLVGALLVPSLAPKDAAKMQILNDSVQTVDLAALEQKDQAKFDASLKASHAKLEALLPLMETASFHLTGNSHIDAAWLWPWTETVDVVKRTFGTALQLMYEYPQYTYTQSAAAYNDWMAQKYPDMNAEIKQRIQEGRWEIVGGMWVEPDLNMPDGESLVRQLLVGKRWYKQAYGVDVRIGWNPDSFGYTWQLPQIYKKSGIDYFVTQKMTWNDTNQLPFKLFWWESPDGSKVLSYFPHDYANDNLSPVRLAADLKQARERAPGLTSMMDLYGIGDHGGGPTRAILDQGVHWSSPSLPPHVVPQMPFGLAQSFFSDVEHRIAPMSQVWNYQTIAHGYVPPKPVEGKISIPTWKSELYFEYHRGVMTSQANHKHNMRTSEEEVLNAEKWASLAWLDGKEYPGNELTEDWKKVLFNQFHDLAAGSGIGVIYKDAQKDYDYVRLSTDAISDKSLITVAERIDTGKSSMAPVKGERIQKVVVFNPLGWARSGDVTVRIQPTDPKMRMVLVADDMGRYIASPTVSGTTEEPSGEIRVHVDDVPALGYKVLSIISPPPAFNHIMQATQAREEDNAYVLENRQVRVAVDKASGCITSLKAGDTEMLASGACGNQLQFFKDTPKDYDAWNVDPGTFDAAPQMIAKADSVVSVKLANGTPAIKVTYNWQKSKFVQTISLGATSDIVDVENDIDWHEAHVLLKASFPVAATSEFATYEIPYGSIERTTLRTNSWEKAQFEVPAMRWADLGDGKHGLSILNKDKYAYDAVGNQLRITLLRSPKWPDPDADMGHQHFHYAIYPHAGTWKDALTVRHGWEYDYPLEAVVTTAHAGSLPAEHSFASVTPENVVLTAVKKAEDSNGLIFRVYEWAGKSSTVEFHVPKGAKAATVTNLMEAPQGKALAVAGDVVKTPIKPYEILTVRVDY
ncbi:alpha-mannosidase [Terracidiphilus sp.]|uniref:alpha-mannosidase n=1 Tax=Terracidiphilus sp. TaxID=1964191 RepID=UPI003C26B3F2